MLENWIEAEKYATTNHRKQHWNFKESEMGWPTILSVFNEVNLQEGWFLGGKGAPKFKAIVPPAVSTMLFIALPLSWQLFHYVQQLCWESFVNTIIQWLDLRRRCSIWVCCSCSLFLFSSKNDALNVFVKSPLHTSQSFCLFFWWFSSKVGVHTFLIIWFGIASFQIQVFWGLLPVFCWFHRIHPKYIHTHMVIFLKHCIEKLIIFFRIQR